MTPARRRTELTPIFEMLDRDERERKETLAHLWAWIAREYDGRREEGAAVASAMLDFLRDYPEAADLGWPVVRDRAYDYANPLAGPDHDGDDPPPGIGLTQREVARRRENDPEPEPTDSSMANAFYGSRAGARPLAAQTDRDPNAPQTSASCDICATNRLIITGPVYAFGPFNAHRFCYNLWADQRDRQHRD